METMLDADAMRIASDMLLDARTALNELTDEGDQMHRRAVIGKPLVAFAHAFLRYSGKYLIDIRVAGQYVERASYSVTDKNQRDLIISKLNTLLEIDPVGIVE